MRYQKTNHLWYREGQTASEEVKKLIRQQNGGKMPYLDKYAEADFANVDIWDVEEKIDGTNIFISLKACRRGQVPIEKKWKVEIGGRTNNTIVPTHLLEYLHDTFTLQRLLDGILNSPVAPFFDNLRSEVVLFGEGYGHKIQGDYYNIGEPKFALFDVRTGSIWVDRSKVRDCARRLNIDTAPFLGSMTVPEIVAYVKSNPQSKINPEVCMEGIVARGEAYTRSYSPTFIANKKFKLRCKDL